MERLSEAERGELWDRHEADESFRSIGRQLGRSPSTVRAERKAYMIKNLRKSWERIRRLWASQYW